MSGAGRLNNVREMIIGIGKVGEVKASESIVFHYGLAITAMCSGLRA